MFRYLGAVCAVPFSTLCLEFATVVITSPRKIARIVSRHTRWMRATDNDPMNAMCQCMDEIYGMLNRNRRNELRRLTGLHEYDASVIAENWYREQRIKRRAHKNPARLEWKRKDSNERYATFMTCLPEQGEWY